MRKRKILTVLLCITGLMMAFQNCTSETYFEEAIDNPNVGMFSVPNEDGTEENGLTPGEEFENQIIVSDPATPNGEGPGETEDPFEPENPDTNVLETIGEWASIAYEDNVLNPDGGDRDYNDAVFNYKISEEYNEQNQLVKILIVVRVREKISGNNHRLFLYFNGNPSSDFDNISFESLPAFLGSANVKITYPNGSVEVKQAVDHVKVVSSTSGSVGKEYKLEVSLNDPELNLRDEGVETIDFKRYRFVLQNHGQDRVGIDIAEINPTDEMIAQSSQYPLGFMIPTDWDPPAEGEFINDKYPNFDLYRQWVLDGAQSPIPDAAYKWFQ